MAISAAWPGLAPSMRMVTPSAASRRERSMSAQAPAVSKASTAASSTTTSPGPPTSASRARMASRLPTITLPASRTTARPSERSMLTVAALIPGSRLPWRAI